MVCVSRRKGNKKTEKDSRNRDNRASLAYEILSDVGIVVGIIEINDYWGVLRSGLGRGYDRWRTKRTVPVNETANLGRC